MPNNIYEYNPLLQQPSNEDGAIQTQAAQQSYLGLSQMLNQYQPTVGGIASLAQSANQDQQQYQGIQSQSGISSGIALQMQQQQAREEEYQRLLDAARREQRIMPVESPYYSGGYYITPPSYRINQWDTRSEPLPTGSGIYTAPTDSNTTITRASLDSLSVNVTNPAPQPAQILMDAAKDMRDAISLIFGDGAMTHSKNGVKLLDVYNKLDKAIKDYK